MYKVFIVDDEEFVVKSLIGSIQWEALGFEVAATAANGREGLELIRSLDIDLVFADVRMPGMSGLELMKEVRKIKPDLMFIIISGYPEFVYVQKSLNYGALGYCLKPFDEAEISKLLVKACNMLNSRSRNINDDFFDLAELIFNTDKRKHLEDQLRLKGLECNEQNGLSVISYTGTDCKGLSMLYSCTSFRTGLRKAYSIIPAKTLEDPFLLSMYDGQICSNIRGVGISEPFYSLDRLQDAIDEANILSYQYFIDGARVCDYTVKKSFLKGDEAVNHIIGSYMREVITYDNIKSELEQLTSCNCINIKHAFRIYNCLAYFNSSCEALNQNSIYGFDELTKLFADFKGMCNYLEKLLINERNTALKERRNINFSNILNYISSNFCTDLNIQEISERYYMNPSYLSQLFRKEVGVTFTDYVTGLRMEFAKELLKDGDRKLIDISQRCGYNDYFYFIRIFKKYFGISPGQYRNTLSI